ncbi:nucleolin 1-like [Zingiber officinale]|uniref:nucleolin 1-like n=1 Tax=Zingiber officinale TaxID=94328 RepID=UPI001C4A82FF|nr:nucleolin 1-like [Zingiber officinale]
MIGFFLSVYVQRSSFCTFALKKCCLIVQEDIAEAAEKHTAPDTNLEKRQESYLFESDADEHDAFEGSSNSEESFEKSSDEESEDEKPLKIPNKNKDVKMKDAIVDSAQKQTKKSEKKVPKTSTVQNPTSGSQTLYVGNLSYDVGPHDLSEFFKGVGEVVGARLATRGKGSSKGFGHVDFASEEDVKKALELNGQEFFGRPLKLEVARGRDSNTPQSGNEKGSKDQSHTIFVKGFDKSLGQDKIRNSLQKHFGSCGDIARISVLKDHESGAPKGMAFVDFKDQIAYKKAFELNGSELDGYTLTIDEGKAKGDNSNGKGKGKGGGKFSGRGGGRGGRGDRGRGRGSGGRGKGRGGGRGGRGDRSRGRGSGGKSRGRGGAERNSSDG